MSTGIVIIGAGLAAYQTATAIRAEDKTIKLTIFTRDSGDYYSKPLLSNAFARNKTADDIAMFSAQQMAERLDAEIKTACEVESINTTEKTLTCCGESYAFDKLVLATGASFNTLPVAEESRQHFMQINHLDHYKNFRHQLGNKKSVLIIGSGFIGCELANDLATAGYEVTVVSADNHPLQRLVPQKIGEQLANHLSQLSITWCFNQFVSGCCRQDDQFIVTTKSGESFTVDNVISAIGIKPDLTLAKNAGLETDNGIVVDDYLQTSAEDIYAIGDCMQHQGRVRAFISPIQQASKLLAKTLTGTPTRVSFPLLPMNVKTLSYPILIFNDKTIDEHQWHVDVTETGAIAKAYENDQLCGFILCGDAIKQRSELVAQLNHA